MKQVISTGGGTVDKVDKWGIRRLAYPVEKRNEGFYVLLQFTAGPEIVSELERRLRVSDLVLKFMTVRIDEKLKKIEKRKKAAREASQAEAGRRQFRRAASAPRPRARLRNRYPAPAPARDTGKGGQ